MRLEFEKQAYLDLQYWKVKNSKKLEKILQLLENIQKTPFAGIGKPEGLKGNYSGLWSRRIDKEHRLIYKIENEIIIVIQARYHYERK